MLWQNQKCTSGLQGTCTVTSVPIVANTENRKVWSVNDCWMVQNKKRKATVTSLSPKSISRKSSRSEVFFQNISRARHWAKICMIIQDMILEWEAVADAYHIQSRTRGVRPLGAGSWWIALSSARSRPAECSWISLPHVGAKYTNATVVINSALSRAALEGLPIHVYWAKTVLRHSRRVFFSKLSQ